MKTLLLFGALVLTLNSLAQLTYVPDDAFEAYIEGYIGGASNGVVNDNYVNTAAIQHPLTNSVQVNGSVYQVTDLTGIEEFTQLRELIIMNSQFTSLDLTILNNPTLSLHIQSNLYLTEVIMPNGGLSKVYIYGNTQLQTIQFHGTNTITIDSPYGLGSFQIVSNPTIAEIDISMISVLATGNLAISGNSLTCIDVANGDCHIWSQANFSGNNLGCINVDNPTYSNGSTYWFWSEQLFDPSVHIYSTSCGSCTTGLNEEQSPTENKQLIKIVDLMGRETPYKPNTILIYVYSDGTTERVFTTPF